MPSNVGKIGEEWWGLSLCFLEMSLRRDKVFWAEQQARIENKNEQIHEKWFNFLAPKRRYTSTVHFNSNTNY